MKNSDPPESSDPASTIHHIVSREHAGLRVDHFLVLFHPETSRALLSNSIKQGLIELNGAAVKASRRIRRGDIVSGSVQRPADLQVTAQKIEFDIVFEDEYLMLISKPPNLVVHPASGNTDNTLVNGLVYHCREISKVGDAVRPGIVHRLDKDTSGIMVVAKTNAVHQRLVEIFKNRWVEKRYTAIVSGIPQLEGGRVVAPIGRHPVHRKKMAIREKEGRYAATQWRVNTVLGANHALLDILIETGRTHQIRVHLASIGHPVVGDGVYGPAKAAALYPRQMLHSSEIRFKHPIHGRKMIGKAPLPQDMERVVDQLQRYGGMV